MGTVTVLGQTIDTVIVLHRWTLTMNTITLSSTGQYWTATLGFADAPKLTLSNVQLIDMFSKSIYHCPICNIDSL